MDGTFKSRDELHALAAAVLGHARGKQITVYCGVGGYASAWWFVLTEILGYRWRSTAEPRDSPLGLRSQARQQYAAREAIGERRGGTGRLLGASRAA